MRLHEICDDFVCEIVKGFAVGFAGGLQEDCCRVNAGLQMIDAGLMLV